MTESSGISVVSSE